MGRLHSYVWLVLKRWNVMVMFSVWFGQKSGMEWLEFASAHLFHVNGEHTFHMCRILF